MRALRVVGGLVPAPDVAAAVARTPPDRDRVVDLLRAASILVVVSGHALMAVVAWRDGVPRLGNALASATWLQPLTWPLQVLPVFFMVGATANAYSWMGAQRRGQRYPAWLWRRTQRLLRPVVIYLLIMAPLGFLADRLGDPLTAEPLLRLTTQLLWFLGAYLWVTAATPWFVRLRESGAAPALVGLVLCTAVVDLMRFALGGPAALGLLNFGTVWLMAGLLGVHLGRPVPRLLAIALALAGLLTNVLLVAATEYPVSLVGMPGDAISNMDPPTLVLAMHALLTFGALSLLWPALTRVAARARVWRLTVAVNLMAMSIYLWHLPVLAALTFVEHGLGWERPTHWSDVVGPVPSAQFWMWTPLHLAVFALLLACTLRVAWITEYAHLPWWDAPAPRGLAHANGAAVAGVVLLGLGIAVLSATGLVGFPTRVVRLLDVPFNSGVAVLLMMTGVSMLRRAGR